MLQHLGRLCDHLQQHLTSGPVAARVSRSPAEAWTALEHWQLLPGRLDSVDSHALALPDLPAASIPVRSTAQGRLHDLY